MRSVLSECLLVLPPLLLHTGDRVRQSQLRGGLRQQVDLLLLVFDYCPCNKIRKKITSFFFSMQPSFTKNSEVHL